jgi:hypothetical protein
MTMRSFCADMPEAKSAFPSCSLGTRTTRTPRQLGNAYPFLPNQHHEHRSTTSAGTYARTTGNPACNANTRRACLDSPAGRNPATGYAGFHRSTRCAEDRPGWETV